MKSSKKLLKRIQTTTSADEIAIEPLRQYPAPFDGQILLACRKCQKKLKGDSSFDVIVKLKKSLKACTKRDRRGVEIRVIPVSCLKMCPKDAVTVVTKKGMTGPEVQVSLLRNADDVAAVYAEYAAG